MYVDESGSSSNQLERTLTTCCSQPSSIIVDDESFAALIIDDVRDPFDMEDNEDEEVAVPAPVVFAADIRAANDDNDDDESSLIGSRFSFAFHALLIRVTTVIADIAA